MNNFFTALMEDGESLREDRWATEMKIKESETLLVDAIEEEYKHSQMVTAYHITYNTMEEGKEPPSLPDLTAEVVKRMTEHLVRDIGSNRSMWSGGNSATNLIEQVRRTVASDMLAQLVYAQYEVEARVKKARDAAISDREEEQKNG